jgi:hypothetical protein
MRSLISVVCVVLVVSLMFVSPLEAKGGRGGGGNGRGGGGGRGGQQGGPKFSGQQQARGAGSNKQSQPGGHATTDKHSDKLASKPDKQDKKPTTTDAGKVTDGTATNNKKQKQLEIAQRQRDKRLEQADHLRDIAERNGNQNLANAADRMEAHAHELYQQRVDQLSKFGVTDPALNPGNATDPGIINPLGDTGGLEPLPSGP